MAIKFVSKDPELACLPEVAKPSRKGIGGRPKKANAKEQISIRLDPMLLALYRAKGDGWQSMINDDLLKLNGL